MKNRTLKVRSGHYDYSFKGKHKYYIPRPVPYVLIKGYWLEEMGFEIGRSLIVEVRKDQIVLTATTASPGPAE